MPSTLSEISRISEISRYLIEHCHSRTSNTATVVLVEFSRPAVLAYVPLWSCAPYPAQRISATFRALAEPLGLSPTLGSFMVFISFQRSVSGAFGPSLGRDESQCHLNSRFSESVTVRGHGQLEPGPGRGFISRHGCHSVMAVCGH